MTRSTFIRLYVSLALIAFFGLVWHSEAADFHQAGLSLHNKYRRAHRAPGVSLDSKLNAAAAKCAKYYANKGKNDHSCPHKGETDGENLAWDPRGSKQLTAKNAVLAGITRWYDEAKEYRYNGPYNPLKTGHFTQLVWKNSRKLGLGVTQNSKGSFVVALYSPPGNYNDDYKNQVKPKAR